jgi:3-oxoacyl-[acyl-carrier protein] reductase
MGELAGKVALVTGGGRGIGRAVVQRLAAEGASVVINDLDVEPAEEVAAGVRGLGGRALVVAGSISQRDFGDRLIAATLEEFGTLDIVVNNAGYATYADAVEMTDQEWDPVLDVLVSAPFRILRAAGRVFRDQAAAADGRPPARKVVNVSSIGAWGSPGSVSYGAGKAAVLGLTYTLALEWARYNVNVNAVAPGLTRTRLTEGPAIGIDSITIEGRELPLTEAKRSPLDSRTELVPLGRVASPEEVAGAIYALCSPDTDFVTGQVLIVDGGMRAGR